MDFFRIHQLPPYLLEELALLVRDARASGQDIIDLSQVNPDLGPPSYAVERLVQATIKPHNHRYSSSQGILKLREAFSEFYLARHSVEVCPSAQVVATMGAKEGIAHLLLTVLAPGDTVLVLSPSYPIHASSVALAGACLIGLPVFSSFAQGERENWQLNENSESFFSSLAESWSRAWPRPKAMLMSFPHNPTGATVTLGFWQRLVDFALDKGILLINDFAYGDICFGGYRAPSILAASGAKDTAVECYSLSKGFGVAGWRVGFAAGQAEVLSALKKIKSYLDFGIFQAVQLASADLLSAEARKEVSVLAETSAIYESRRDVLFAGLRSANWSVVRPQAGVFVWSRLPEEHRERGARDFCQCLLRNHGVAASPGVGFDFQSLDCVRFALVESEARIRKAIREIQACEESDV